MPAPTRVFFLNMPTKYAIELMKNRENKFTHEKTKDIHEKDASHMLDSYNAACSLIDKYNWCEIKCVKDEKIRTIEEIHEDIYNEVKKYL